MSTLESTISMLRVMPEAEVQVIFDLTKAMFEKRSTPFQPVGREEVLRDLDLSDRQIANGNYHVAKEAIEALKARYGV